MLHIIKWLNENEVRSFGIKEDRPGWIHIFHMNTPCPLSKVIVCLTGMSFKYMTKHYPPPPSNKQMACIKQSIHCGKHTVPTLPNDESSLSSEGLDPPTRMSTVSTSCVRATFGTIVAAHLYVSDTSSPTESLAFVINEERSETSDYAMVNNNRKIHWS